MRIHALLHSSFDSACEIKKWAASRQHTITFTRTYSGEKLPNTSDFDFLILLGGPQSLLKLEKYPYLHDEIALTHQAILDHKIVLGICLGAQIIGEALGEKTQVSPHQEIGLHAIERSAAGALDPLFQLFPETMQVMHWHNDMSGLPTGAVILATSAGCPRQAIHYRDRVYGLQFHLEMTQTLVQALVAHCGEELQPGRFVRDSAALSSADYQPCNQQLIVVLDHLTQSAA